MYLVWPDPGVLFHSQSLKPDDKLINAWHQITACNWDWCYSACTALLILRSGAVRSERPVCPTHDVMMSLLNSRFTHTSLQNQDKC
jgi:hypothetical protein